jgi:riboflavin synthase alpha subunit
MFTGIVQHVGPVAGVETAPCRHASGGQAYGLGVDLGPLAADLALGASVAVSGVCLTVAALRGTVARFDVVPETWGRTTLHGLRVGDPVNLERSLRVGDPLDGHFVQGHVEGVGGVVRVERGEGQWKVWVEAQADLMPAIVPKGSIALDGTSLTVVDVEAARFSVVLVPTTLQRTVLGRRRAGDQVNIETDLLTRVILGRLAGLAKLELSSTADSAPGAAGLSWDKLRAAGFLP